MTAHDNITPVQHMICSCTGALATSLLVTPLDVVKIRLQAQQKQFVKNKCFLYCNGLMEHMCYCLNGNGNGIANGHSAHSMVSGGQWYKRPGHFNGTFSDGCTCDHALLHCLRPDKRDLVCSHGGTSGVAAHLDSCYLRSYCQSLLSDSHQSTGND